MTEELDYDNFKAEVGKEQSGPVVKTYFRYLSEVWATMSQFQDEVALAIVNQKEEREAAEATYAEHHPEE